MAEKGQVFVHWGITRGRQDGAFAAGIVAGVPEGLYDSTMDLVTVLQHPRQAFAALKELVSGDDVLGTVAQNIKQDWLNRIDKMEAHYQRAGANGAYAAGVDAGKLLFEFGGYALGIGGVAKGGGRFASGQLKRFEGRGVESVRQHVTGIRWGRNIHFGNVLGEYSAIKPGPLESIMAETFAGGRYKEIVLNQDIIMYRAGISDIPLGQYFSIDKQIGVIQTRIDKAVLPAWASGAKSPIDTVFGIKIPAETKIYIGNVGSQNGFYIGGTQQIVIPTPWRLSGIEVISKESLK